MQTFTMVVLFLALVELRALAEILEVEKMDEMVEKVPDQAKEECHKIEIQDLRPQQQES